LGNGTAGGRIIKANDGIERDPYYRNQGASSQNSGGYGRHASNPIASKNMAHMKNMQK